MIRIVSLLLVPVLGVLAVRAEEAFTPKPGSEERKAILDAVRDPLEDILHQPILFRVNHLKVKDGWAFLKGQARTSEDKPIDYQRTRFAEEAAWMDETLVAVLRFKKNRWYVVTHGLFTTDVWWLGIHEELKAPIEIFDYPPSP